jgi:hypothetical protein
MNSEKPRTDYIQGTSEKGRCCNSHIPLNCSETKQWKERFLSSKRLNINEEVLVACKRIINSTNAAELRSIGIYLCKIRCKWENKISNTLLNVGKRGSRITVYYNNYSNYKNCMREAVLEICVLELCTAKDRC